MDTKWKPRLLRKDGQDNILNGILTLIEGRAPLKEKKSIGRKRSMLEMELFTGSIGTI